MYRKCSKFTFFDARRPNVVYFTAIVAQPGCRITGGVVSAVSGTWKEASGAVKTIGTRCRYGDITQLLHLVGDLHLHV